MKLLLDLLPLQPRFVLEDANRILTHEDFSCGKDGVLEALHLAFRDLGRKPQELKWLAYNRGPGSFTGIKVGTVTAQAMALASGARLQTFTSFDWMRHLSRDQDAVMVLNAYQGEWFQAHWEGEQCSSAVSEHPIWEKKKAYYLGHPRYCPDWALALEEEDIAQELIRFFQTDSFSLELEPLYLKKSNAERVREANGQ